MQKKNSVIPSAQSTTPSNQTTENVSTTTVAASQITEPSQNQSAYIDPNLASQSQPGNGISVSAPSTSVAPRKISQDILNTVVRKHLSSPALKDNAEASYSFLEDLKKDGYDPKQVDEALKENSDVVARYGATNPNEEGVLTPLNSVVDKFSAYSKKYLTNAGMGILGGAEKINEGAAGLLTSFGGQTGTLNQKADERSEAESKMLLGAGQGAMGVASVTVPAAMTFIAGSDAIKNTADATLSPDHAKTVNNIIDFPSQMVSVVGPKIFGEAEPGSEKDNWFKLGDLAAMALTMKGVDVGVDAVKESVNNSISNGKSISVLKDISEKAAKGEVSPEDTNKINDIAKSISIDDIKKAAIQDNTPESKIILDKINEAQAKVEQQHQDYHNTPNADIISAAAENITPEDLRVKSDAITQKFKENPEAATQELIADRDNMNKMANAIDIHNDAKNNPQFNIEAINQDESLSPEEKQARIAKITESAELDNAQKNVIDSQIQHIRDLKAISNPSSLEFYHLAEEALSNESVLPRVKASIEAAVDHKELSPEEAQTQYDELKDRISMQENMNPAIKKYPDIAVKVADLAKELKEKEEDLSKVKKYIGQEPDITIQNKERGIETTKQKIADLLQEAKSKDKAEIEKNSRTPEQAQANHDEATGLGFDHPEHARNSVNNNLKEGETPYERYEDIPKERLAERAKDRMNEKTIGVSYEAQVKRSKELGEEMPVRGEGITAEEAVKVGQKLILKGADPEKIAEDYKNNGTISGEGVSIVRAHNAALAKITNEAIEKYGKDSDEAKVAVETEKNWYKDVVARMKTEWHKIGMTLQGETEVDTGTFRGLERAFQDHNGGKEMSSEQIKEARELSGKVKSLSGEVEELKKKLAETIDKSKQEDNLEKEKTIKEKAKKIADIVRKGKINRPDVFNSSSPAAIIWDGALDITAKSIEISGDAAQAIIDGIDHIKKSDWYKGITDKSKQLKAESEFKKYWKNELKEKEELISEEDSATSKNIVREAVEKGNSDVGSVVKYIKENYFPDKSDRQIRDDITKYGKTKIPNTDPIEKIIREIKTIGNLLSKLEDVEKGERPKMTGYLRDKLTDEARALQKKLNEAMKDLPADEERDSKKLATAQDRIKTALENSIKDLNEQIENGERNPKIKPIEYNEYNKALKEQVSELRKTLGDILKEKEDIEAKKDLHLQFIDKKDSKFTPEESRIIWNYAKEEYLDKGTDYNDMLGGVSIDLGLTADQVRRAISQPKGAREITDQMYLKMAKYREADAKAKNWVKSADDSKVLKFLKAIPNFFFALKTFGHGTVAPITHAGMNVFLPTNWKGYFSNMGDAYKFAFGGTTDKGLVKYEQAMADMQNDPQYAMWKRAGLAIDMASHTDDYHSAEQNIFGKAGQIGVRGFNALKIFRLESAKSTYEKLSNAAKADPQTVKEVARIINNSTGTSDLRVSGKWGGVINASVFAPKLEGSRWAKLIVSPAKALGTIVKMGENERLKLFGKEERITVTPSEKTAAKIYSRRAGEMLATYAAFLAVNQGLLSVSGSKQKINVTDPSQPDWMKFKIGGKNIDISGGMVSTIDFISKLFEQSMGNQKALKGANRSDKMFETTGKYLRGKLSPIGGTIFDFTTHHDFVGNTMPGSSDKPQSHAHKLSWKEYLLQQQTPIPVAEAIKDVTESMKDKGLSKPHINEILNGIFIGAVSGSTGAHLSADQLKKK